MEPRCGPAPAGSRHRASLEQRLGLGLRPDLLLFASAAVDAPASLTRGLSIAFGAATGADAQACAALVSPNGAAPGSVGGAQRTDAAIVAVTDRTSIESLGRVTSVDPDGVTLGWSQTSTVGRQVLYLGLSGARCQLASEFSPIEPGRRRRRGLGVSRARASVLQAGDWDLVGGERHRTTQPRWRISTFRERGDPLGRPEHTRNRDCDARALRCGNVAARGKHSDR